MKYTQLKMLLFTCILLGSVDIFAADEWQSASQTQDEVTAVTDYLAHLQSIVDHGHAILEASQWSRAESGDKKKALMADLSRLVLETSNEKLVDTFGEQYTINHTNTIQVKEKTNDMMRSFPEVLCSGVRLPDPSYRTWAKQAFFTSLSLNNPLRALNNPLIGGGVLWLNNAIEQTKLLPSKLTSTIGFLAKAQAFISGYNQLRRLHTIVTIKHPSLPRHEAAAAERLKTAIAAGKARLAGLRTGRNPQ